MLSFHGTVEAAVLGRKHLLLGRPGVRKLIIEQLGQCDFSWQPTFHHCGQECRLQYAHLGCSRIEALDWSEPVDWGT